MSLTCKFYTFSKKVNSTARPTGGTTYNCTLKQATDIISPRLELNANQTTAPTFNYVYISDFSRYYWIDRWTWDRGLWIADLSVDALASWKTYIGASSNYVTRSASSYNLNLTDDIWATENGTTVTTNFTMATGSTYPFGALDAPSLGCYVIGVVNDQAGSMACSNAITYYVLTYSEMRTLTQYLLGDISYMNITDIGAELAKGIINPFEYIVSCMWLPFAYTEIASATATVISVGWWQPSVSLVGHALKSAAFTKTYTFNMAVPKHPQAATYGAYLNAAPYTSYMVTFGPWGSFALDPQIVYGETNVRFDVDLDLISGDAALFLGTTTSPRKTAARYAQIGVPVQMSQLGYNAGGIIGTAVSAVGGVIGALTSPADFFSSAGILSATRTAMAQPETSGSQGSYVSLVEIPEIVGTFYSIVGKDITHLGAPLCEMKTINTLSGYVKVNDPDVPAPATAAELEQIRGYMASGFYYE